MTTKADLKNRFNKYGDDADGRNVMEFENADLTLDELWTKHRAANEAGEDEIEACVYAEICRRRPLFAFRA